MTWQFFDTTFLGEPFQVLLDDQFVADTPGEELPNFAWFGVWCLQDTGERFWNHASRIRNGRSTSTGSRARPTHSVMSSGR